jgi:hypothetical protein
MFIKSTTEFKEILSINSFKNIIDKEKKLILFFSKQNCSPCISFENILDSIYNSDNHYEDLPLIIKINSSHLLDDDKKFIEKFPSIFIITPENLSSLNDDESLLQFINNNKVIKYIGMPTFNFFDENNLNVEF